MGSSLRAFSKMKTIISLIFVLGTVSCHGSYYRSVYSPYYRTRQYSTYGRSYSPLYDPVCAAALDAYIESYLGGASEEKANEAAGKAFVSAVDANPSFKMDSHCGKAAQAFMANF